jgi:hypothetical protein
MCEGVFFLSCIIKKSALARGSELEYRDNKRLSVTFCEYAFTPKKASKRMIVKLLIIHKCADKNVQKKIIKKCLAAQKK